MRPLVVVAAVCALGACRYDTSGLDGEGVIPDAPTSPDAKPGPDAPPTPDAGVAPDAPPVNAIDAALPDAATCPGFCTSCDLVTSSCVVDCSDSTCSAGIDVVCPPGWSCRIDCLGADACRSGPVSCDGMCEIVCEGTRACEQDSVSCTGSTCTISCDGTDTCDSGVYCDATMCTILCTGSGSCEDLGVCCGGVDCGNACAAMNGGNCNCP